MLSFRGKWLFIINEELVRVDAYHHGNDLNRVAQLKIKTRRYGKRAVGTRKGEDNIEILRILGWQKGIPVRYKKMQTG